jgi:cobalt-zinc-cadmium efflux system protein
MDGIRQYLNDLENVVQIHDLHVWPLSTTEVALTVHLVVTENDLNNKLLRKIQDHLAEQFHIGHATIQIEKQDADKDCLLDNC